MTEWIKLGQAEADALNLHPSPDVLPIEGGYLVTVEEGLKLRARLPEGSPLNRILDSLTDEAEIRVKLEDIFAPIYASKPGALTAILSSGRTEGAYLVLTPEAYARIRSTYGIEARCSSCGG